MTRKGEVPERDPNFRSGNAPVAAMADGHAEKTEKTRW